MSLDPDTTRIVRSWLEEGATRLPDRVLDVVLDQVPATPQRRATWWPARRLTPMNNALKFGLAAVVVAVAALIGLNYLGASNVGGPGIDSSTASPEATPTATPSPSPEAATESLVVTDPDSRVQVTVQTAQSGWSRLSGLDGITKRDDGLDPPDSVGAALLAWGWPAGTAFDVYADPCRWSTTAPETPATTPAEIAEAFSAQASTEPTDPVDVTVGGFAGKAVTLRVPLSFDVPNATREERFADCDQNLFGFYGVDGDTEPARDAQGGGQIDELWILDVDGSIMILDAAYSESTPAELVDELRALAESATFEVP